MRSVPIPRRQQRRAVRWLAQQPGNELSLPAENPGAVQPARIHHLVVGVRWQGQREVCASSILRGHPACAWHSLPGAACGKRIPNLLTLPSNFSGRRKRWPIGSHAAIGASRATADSRLAIGKGYVSN